MLRYLLIPIFLFVAGCAQVPPSPQETQAKKFDSVPGMAVIYIVRAFPDHYDGHGFLSLDGTIPLTTFAGQFYRWEVAPGAHRIAGMGQDMSQITINAEAGKVYFVQHAVTGFRGSTHGGYLSMLSDQSGRRMVQRASLVGG